MKRRLTIARALVSDPELMLLDEPTTGLDPQARHALWDRLYRLKQRGVTLVLTTHYMDEAEQLCDRLVIMDRAKIVAEGSPRTLIDRFVEREVVELRFGTQDGVPPRRRRRARRGAAGQGRDRHERRRRCRRPRARARARARDRARAPLDAGGRLPPAHRPQPRRLMDAARRTLAVVGWHARGFRRMWRGSLTVSFLNPIFFLLSIGLLLGKLVDRSSPDAGGLTYLEFVAPALLATTAMQTAASETTFPVKAGLKWLQTYHAVVSTPVRVGELVAGILTWTGIRVVVAVSVFAVVAGASGAFESPCGARPSRGAPLRARVRRGAGRDHLDGRGRRLAGGDLPLRPRAALSLLGHVLPGRAAARLGRADRLGDTAVARRRALP